MFCPVTNDDACRLASQMTDAGKFFGLAEPAHRCVPNDLAAPLGVAAVIIEQQLAILFRRERNQG